MLKRIFFLMSLLFLFPALGSEELMRSINENNVAHVGTILDNLPANQLHDFCHSAYFDALLFGKAEILELFLRRTIYYDRIDLLDQPNKRKLEVKNFVNAIIGSEAIKKVLRRPDNITKTERLIVTLFVRGSLQPQLETKALELLTLLPNNASNILADSTGKPVSFILIERKKAAALKTLLQKVNSYKKQKYKGMSMIHWAVKYNSRNIIAMLLIQSINKIHERDDNGNTPLYYAIQNKNRSTINFLYRRGARIEDCSGHRKIYAPTPKHPSKYTKALRLIEQSATSSQNMQNAYDQGLSSSPRSKNAESSLPYPLPQSVSSVQQKMDTPTQFQTQLMPLPTQTFLVPPMSMTMHPQLHARIQQQLQQYFSQQTPSHSQSDRTPCAAPPVIQTATVQPQTTSANHRRATQSSVLQMPPAQVELSPIYSLKRQAPQPVEGSVLHTNEGKKARTPGETEALSDALNNVKQPCPPTTDRPNTHSQSNFLLHNAVIAEDLFTIKQLLDEGLNIDTKDENGKTALDLALQQGDNGTAHYLICRGASLLDQPRDILFSAIKQCTLETVKIIMKRCKDQNITFQSQDLNAAINRARQLHRSAVANYLSQS